MPEAFTLEATTDAASLGDHACGAVLLQVDPDAAGDVVVGTALRQTIRMSHGDRLTVPKLENARDLYVRALTGSITVNWLAIPAETADDAPLALTSGQEAMASSPTLSSLRLTAVPAAALTTLPVLLSGDLITDAVRRAAQWGDGRDPEGSIGIWGPITPVPFQAPGAIYPGTDGNARYSATEEAAGSGSYWVTGGVVPTRSLTGKFGNTSYQCVTPGSVQREGFWVGIYPVTSGHYYAAGGWVWGTGTLFVAFGDGATGYDFKTVVLSATPQYVPLARLASGSEGNDRIAFVTNAGTPQAITFHVGGVQLLADEPLPKPYAGGIHRDGGRIQLPATILTVADGALVIRGVFDFPSTQAGVTENPVVARWEQDASHYLHLLYDMAAHAWVFQRRDGGSTSQVSVAGSFASGAPWTVAIDRTATTLRLSVNGSAWVSLGNTALPVITAPTFELGSLGGVSNFLNGRLFWAVLYPSALGSTAPATIGTWTNAEPDWTAIRSVAGSGPIGRWNARSPGYLEIEAAGEASETGLAAGSLGIGMPARTGVAVSVSPRTAAGTGIAVHGQPAQTGNLFELWTDGALGTVANSKGQIVAPLYAVDGPRVTLNTFWRTRDPDWFNALRRLETFAREHGGIIVEAEPGDYPIAVPILSPSFASPENRQAVCRFRSLRGVALLMPTCRFVDTTVYGNTLGSVAWVDGADVEWGQYGSLFEYEDCTNVTADLNVDSQRDGVVLNGDGQIIVAGLLVHLLRANTQHYMIRGTFDGCGQAVSATPGLGILTSPSPAHGIVDLICTETHYPMVNAYGGNDCTARIRADRCGRSYYVYNVSQQRAEVQVTNQRVQSIIGVRHLASGVPGTTRDVALFYSDHSAAEVPPHVDPSAQLWISFIAMAGQPGGTLADIRVRLDVDAIAPNYGNILAIAKQTGDGGVITTGNGATLDGLDVSGVVRTHEHGGGPNAHCIVGTDADESVPTYGQFSTAGTRDTVKRVRFHDLSLRSAAKSMRVDFGGAADVDPVIFDNVTAEGSLIYANGAAGHAKIRDTTAPNLTGLASLTPLHVTYDDTGESLSSRRSGIGT